MARRTERAAPVGDASQPAAANSTPTTITVVAMLVISEVPMSQVAFAAGLTLSVLTSWSTTIAGPRQSPPAQGGTAAGAGAAPPPTRAALGVALEGAAGLEDDAGAVAGNRIAEHAVIGAGPQQRGAGGAGAGGGARVVA